MATNNRLHGPVLLITDLSPRCDRAMDRAAALAQLHDVPLIALHVMDTPWLTRLTEPAWRSVQQHNIELAEQRLRDDLAHIDIELFVIVETGNPIEVIKQVATTNQCSLIVCGTARDETLGRIVLGTTVERLARRTTTPLLVVRTRPHTPYANVVLATDFSAGSRQALIALSNLAEDAAITLYHAFDQVAGIYELDKPTMAEQISALAGKAKAFGRSTPGFEAHELPVVVEHGTPHERLSEYVDTHHVELVVMGTHGVTGLVRTAMGSVAEKLLATLKCDLLIVPQAQA